MCRFAAPVRHRGTHAPNRPVRELPIPCPRERCDRCSCVPGRHGSVACDGRYLTRCSTDVGSVSGGCDRQLALLPGVHLSAHRCGTDIRPRAFRGCFETLLSCRAHPHRPKCQDFGLRNCVTDGITRGMERSIRWVAVRLPSTCRYDVVGVGRDSRLYEGEFIYSAAGFVDYVSLPAPTMCGMFS